MSFVRDDSKYTRGVGAIASTDAVSSVRRRAAARSAVAMARRDAVMARHTLGLINTADNAGDGAEAPSRPSNIGKPLPPKPVPPPTTKIIPRGQNIGVYAKDGMTIKSPGSVLPPPTPAPVPVTPPTGPLLPPRPVITIVATPGSMLPVGPKPPVQPIDMPPMEQLPELPSSTSSPTTNKPSGNLLMYALVGVGALWLLTRE